MQGVPAYCSYCGHVFLAPNLVGGAVGSQFVIKNSATFCERCKHPASIADGYYRMSQTGLVLVNGPTITRHIVDRLAAIANRAREQAKKGTISAEEFLTEISDVSPELAEKLKAKHSLPVVVLVLVLIWLIKGVNLNITVDVNRLIDQAVEETQHRPVDTILEKAINSRSRPEPIRQDQYSFGIAATGARPNRKTRRKSASQARKKT